MRPGIDSCWHCASISAGDRACVFHGCTAQKCNCPTQGEAMSDYFNARANEAIESQTWSDETLLCLVEKFLSQKGLHDEFGEFLQKEAEEENREEGPKEDEG